MLIDLISKLFISPSCICDTIPIVCNRKIPKNIRDSLDIRPVRWVDQVLEAALEFWLLSVPVPVLEF